MFVALETASRNWDLHLLLLIIEKRNTFTQPNYNAKNKLNKHL